jgi:hypothetical protein
VCCRMIAAKIEGAMEYRDTMEDLEVFGDPPLGTVISGVVKFARV